MSGKPLRDQGGPVPAWTLPQRWVLASQGVLTELFRAHPERMGGLPRPLASNFAALFLRRDWGVRTRREAIAQVESLLARGHRVGYAAQTEHTSDELLAWDLVRASAVAGWAYCAYMLEADEAWPLMLRAARELRRSFDSWEAVGTSYLMARRLWSENGDAELQPVIDRLMAPGGGWDLPWEVDLEGDIPAPVEPIRQVVVDPAGGGDFRTIGEAIAAAGVADEVARITVRAGTYDESVRVTYPVELIADGEVTIRSAEGPALRMDRQCALVRGFSLESGTSAAGVAMNAVFLQAHLLKLVDCTIRSARCGVYAKSAKAFLTLERCRVEGAVNTGVLGEEGAHVILVDTVVRRTGGVGVLARGDGELCIESSRIEDAGNSGLGVAGSVLVEIAGLTVERSGHNGIELLERSRCILGGLDVRGSAQTGLLASTGGGVELTDSHIGGSGGNDLGVATGQVTARGTTLGGGPGCGLCVCAGAHARLEGCIIESTGMPSAIVMGGGEGVFLGCDLRGGRDIALWVMPDGSAFLRECTITGGAKSGALLRQARKVHFAGGTITSDTGCLFAVASTEVVLSGTRLTGGSPAVCAQEAGDLVLIDVAITTDGAVALAIEGGASAALTRTVVEAAKGTALTLEKGEAHLYRSNLGGQIAATVCEASVLRSWAGETAGAVQGAFDRVDIDEALHAPGTLTLLGGRRLALELDATALEAALVPHGLTEGPALAATWLDRALAAQPGEGAIAIRPTPRGATLESDDLGRVHQSVARVRALLTDPGRLEELAAQVRAANTGPGPLPGRLAD